MKKKTKIISALAVLAVLAGPYGAVRFVPKILRWRHLDATYQESFPAPADLAAGLKGKRVLFHIKTGLDQDDSQICVGFNVVFAAIEAGAEEVTVLFDAGATLDLTEEGHNLASTGVPLRLRKVIAAQLNLPLETMPKDYKEYLELLHKRRSEGVREHRHERRHGFQREGHDQVSRAALCRTSTVSYFPRVADGISPRFPGRASCVVVAPRDAQELKHL